ncbi:MAG: hypothetical protein BZY88_05200 [SAR202 cluster bacterium Io17-Chloro-G9]|nr:MAG: hypothetical protein BZY88_05200 [SAR202 cluster bacterium Io17-Chloro-G9]
MKLTPETMIWEPTRPEGGLNLMLRAGTLWVAVVAVAVGQPNMVAVTALTDGTVPADGTVIEVSKEPSESGRTSASFVPA